jgi:hypothetical protein
MLDPGSEGPSPHEVRGDQSLRGVDMELIIQLIAGAIGGNAAGAGLKNLSLGTAGNSIAGILGGGIGGQILSMVMGGAGGDAAAAVAGLDFAAIASSLASGGVGGAVMLVVAGVVKNMMAK